MIALQPASIDWSVAEIEIDDGWTTNQFNASASRMDVVAVLDELTAWATSTFAAAFSWTMDRDADTGGAVVTLATSSGTFTIEATNAAAQAGYGLSAGVHAAASSHTFDAPAAGTWSPVAQVSVRNNIRSVGRGDACGNGAIRPGSPGIGANAPAVSAYGTAVDAGRIAEQLADASNPRRARVYQLHTGLWLELAIGTVQRSPSGLLYYRFTIDAAGDAI